MRTVVTGGQLTMLSFTFTWFFRPCNKIRKKNLCHACTAKPSIFRAGEAPHAFMLYFRVNNEAVKQNEFSVTFLVAF